MFPSSLSLEKLLQYLLGIFLFLLPWQTIWIYEEQFVGDSKWELTTLGYYATEMLLWITVIIFLFWFWQRKRHDLFGARVHFSWSADRMYALACAVFIIYGFCSVVWAIHPDIAWQHALRITLSFILFFLLFIGPLGAKQAMWWFVAGAAAQSALGIWQFVTQSTIESSLFGLAVHPAWEAGTSIVSGDHIGRWLRAYGSFQHPNIFGGYLVISLLFTTWLSNQIHVFHSSSTARAIGKIIGLALLFDIQILALILTFSRGAWLAFGFFLVGLFAGCLYRGYHYLTRLSVYMMVFITIFLFIFAPLVMTRLGGTSLSEQRSIHERMDGYAQARSIIADHMWFGVGVGNYTAVLHERYPTLSGWQLQPVHSTPLLFIAEFGIVGLLLYMGVFMTFIRYQYASIQRDKRAVVRKPYALAYIFYSIVFILLTLFDHYWISTYVGLMLLMAFWAIILRSIREEDEVLC